MIRLAFFSEGSSSSTESASDGAGVMMASVRENRSPAEQRKESSIKERRKVVSQRGKKKCLVLASDPRNL
jgi:hypothetical protein